MYYPNLLLCFQLPSSQQFLFAFLPAKWLQIGLIVTLRTCFQHLGQAVSALHSRDFPGGKNQGGSDLKIGPSFP